MRLDNVNDSVLLREILAKLDRLIEHGPAHRPSHRDEVARILHNNRVRRKNDFAGIRGVAPAPLWNKGECPPSNSRISYEDADDILEYLSLYNINLGEQHD